MKTKLAVLAGMVLAFSTAALPLPDGKYVCFSSSMNGPSIQEFTLTNVSLPNQSATVPYVVAKINAHTLLQGFGSVIIETETRC